MDQQSEPLRERLFAQLPQPQRLAEYREQTASLMAKHERALRTDLWNVRVLYWTAGGLWFFFNSKWNPWPNLDPQALHMLGFLAAVIAFAGALYDIRYRIYSSQVDTLKEIKQTQLQILELRATLEQRSSAGL